jgi:hypothetical protein
VSASDFVPCYSPRHSTYEHPIPGCVCALPEPDLLASALGWAARGIAVFPVHSAKNGRCSCGDASCKRIAKHPRTHEGFHDATTDPEVIRAWWAKWPTANIGWAAGATSGLWVIDIDSAEARAALDELEVTHGALPTTLTIRTGREGGEHRLFCMPDDGDVRNTTSRIYKEIDVRGTGGYAILPPSLHETGRRYTVVLDAEPVAAPAWLVELARRKPTQPQAEQRPAGREPTVFRMDGDGADQRRLAGIVSAACKRIETAIEGNRNETANRECYGVGGWLDGLGGTVDQVAPALEAAAVTAGQDPHLVRRALEDGRAASRGRPPDEQRDSSWSGRPSGGSSRGESDAGPDGAPPPDPDWLVTLRAAVDAQDATPLYGRPDVLLGIVRPGMHAGEVEALMSKLPHAVRLALRRAGKALDQEHRSKSKGKRHAEPKPLLPLVVEHGHSIWVHDPTCASYLVCSPRAATSEVIRLHQVDAVIHGEKSDRLMSCTELYDAYGVTASRVQWSYDAAGPEWDRGSRTLVLPGAKVREGTARYSEDVAQWLFRFVPHDQLDRLLDWLATAARLDRQTAAPQFRGPGSAGKGMLVLALTNWLGGRCDYLHATGPFNGCLIEAPLVVLDEGIAESMPNAFRSLTGSSMHKVVSKNRMPEDLFGCPRIVVTSNEPDPLRLGREELSAWSEEALGRRILMFDVQQAAADWLLEYGGIEATDGWCKPEGELVCMLRWLAENRVVVPGKRFLVEGDAASWVANAHRRAGVSGDIVAAYAVYQDFEEEQATSQFVGSEPFRYFHGHKGFVGVSVRGLQQHWKTLVGDLKVPSHQRLSKALQQLSQQDVPVRPEGASSTDRPRVYLVPVTTLAPDSK